MSILQTVGNTSLPLDPLHYLLGLPFPGIKKATKFYILLGARRVIPMSWLSRDLPTLSMFLNTIIEIGRMEYLTASATKTIQKFNKIWELWDTSEYGVAPSTS